MDITLRNQGESRALESVDAQTVELLDLLLNREDYEAAAHCVRAAHPDALRAALGQLVNSPDRGNLIDMILEHPAKGARLHAVITLALILIRCRAADAACAPRAHAPAGNGSPPGG